MSGSHRVKQGMFPSSWGGAKQGRHELSALCCWGKPLTVAFLCKSNVENCEKMLLCVTSVLLCLLNGI